MGPRRLLDYLLVHIADGKGRFDIGGTAYEAAAGDLFWIPPDTVHRMAGHPPSMLCPYVHFDLVYRPVTSHWDFSIPEGMTDLEALKPLMHPRFDHPLLAGLTGRIRGPTNRRVGELIREICAEAARAQPYAGLRLSGLMTEILAEILRGRAGVKDGQNASLPLLEQAADHLWRHCAEAVSVEDLAGICDLSPSHFRLLFARHFGCSPRTYLRRARIRKAKGLMIGSSLSLTEIARRCGFATGHSFSRTFHDLEGIPPSDYRRCGTGATRVEGRRAPYSH
jgi:AraC-like DNA-binding protein